MGDLNGDPSLENYPCRKGRTAGGASVLLTSGEPH